MIQTLKSRVLEHWDDIAPGVSKPKDLSYMLQGSQSYRAPYTKVIVLFFRPGDDSPVVVGKVPDDPQFAGIVEREYEHIKRMHDGPYPDALKNAIPRPIALEQIGKDIVLLETAIVGESMSLQLLRNARDEQYMREAFEDALAWLTLMQNDELKGEAGAAQATAVVEETLGYYRELYSPEGDEKQVLEDAWAVVKPLIGAGLPVVPVHGDFWVNNIFRRERQVVGVLDWEFARPASIPVWDLFQFEFSMGIAANPKIELRGIFLTAFFRDGSLKQGFRKATRAYCKAQSMDYDPKVIEALFVLWLADRAVNERYLFGRSYETDMLRHDNMSLYLENRKPNWGTFAD